MRFARRLATAAGLTLVLGAAIASPVAAGDLLGGIVESEGEGDAPGATCLSSALPFDVPCIEPPPIEIEVAPPPALDVVLLEPGVPLAELPPPISPLEPIMEEVVELVETVPAMAPAVAPPLELLSAPVVEVGTGLAAAAAETSSRPQTASAAPYPSGDPAPAPADLAPAGPPASVAPASQPSSEAVLGTTFTASIVHATATPAGSDPAPAAAPTATVPAPLAALALTPAIGSAAAAAVELARTIGASGIVFNVWLRRQLRERRMSQRQLAAFSGVDHSTISRLLSGARAPSLATATKLAEALRKLGDPDHAADYFARVSESEPFPTKRVEAALLGDDELEDEDVRELMNAYLVVRMRRRRQRLGARASGEAEASAGA